MTTCLVQIIVSYKKNQLKKVEEEKLNVHGENIENCLDIDNKNKRTISENIRLSEYCINKFANFR